MEIEIILNVEGSESQTSQSLTAIRHPSFMDEIRSRFSNLKDGRELAAGTEVDESVRGHWAAYCPCLRILDAT